MNKNIAEVSSSSSWGQFYVTHDGKEHGGFIYDKETGSTYNNNSKNLVRFKCAVLCIRTIPEAIGRIVYHALIIPTAATQTYRVLTGRITFREGLKEMGHSLMDIFRSTIYGVGMLFSALEGAIVPDRLNGPLNGRKHYGHLECLLNRQKGLHIKEKLNGNKYYSAPCFQNLSKFERDENGNMTNKEKVLEITVKNIRVQDKVAKKMNKFFLKFSFKKKNKHVEEISRSIRKKTSFSSEHIPSKNIVNSQLIKNKVLFEEWKPKVGAESLGRFQGLRIPQTMQYKNVQSLCLGMSFSFLKHFLKESTKEAMNDRVRESGQLFSQGAPLDSLKNQTLYSALIGEEGIAPEEERRVFLSLLKGYETTDENLSPSKQKLYKSIESYLDLPEPRGSLRKWVIKDLEDRNVPLSLQMYRLILFLDNKSGTSPIFYEQAATTIIAKTHGLKIDYSHRFQGENGNAVSILENLSPGAYMIQLREPVNHTIVFIKGEQEGESALFDSNAGTDLFNTSEEQKKTLESRLQHYFVKESVVFDLYKVKK